eukprot:13311637-Alexandrium_andersonii.AAC.1
MHKRTKEPSPCLRIGSRRGPPSLTAKRKRCRLSPIPGRGDGRLARWASWDRVPLGLDCGTRTYFHQWD